MLIAQNSMCMNKKYIHNKTNFNIRLNKDEFEMIKFLKDDCAINISQAFKNFLKERFKNERRKTT